MNFTIRGKTIRVALKRKKKKKREEEEPWHGSGHPHFSIDIP